MQTHVHRCAGLHPCHLICFFESDRLTSNSFKCADSLIAEEKLSVELTSWTMPWL